MILGIVSAVFFLLMCSKIITKLSTNRNIDKKMGKLHKIAGVIFLLIICAHMILAVPLIKQRPIGMYLSGGLILVLTVVCIASYFLRGKLKKKWITIHRTLAVLIFMCLIIHVYFGISSTEKYQKKVAEIEIHNINAQNISDGIYTGEYDVQYIYAKVKVTVKDEKIEDITLLEHRNERGKSAESILDTIVEKQQVEVDAVTQATNSSRVIMKAVDNALEKGKSIQ